MDQQTTNLFTIIFSIYGAFVSTVSFIIAIVSVYVAWLAYHRDNPKIKIKVSSCFFMPSSIDEGVKIFINVINHGRRPVVINNAGFLLSDGKTIVSLQPFGIKFPYELTEGNKCEVIYDKKELLITLKDKDVKITHAWADDATGKRHKTKYELPI